MKRIFCICLGLYLLAVFFAGGAVVRALAADKMLTDEAERIYKSYGGAIYQVQVIDVATSKKTAIGSGFQVSADGVIATNYHVIAGAIGHAGQNRLEYLRDHGGSGTLTILAADIVHDLAILKMDKPGGQYLTLGTSRLPKGARLFSLGNPHDLGFTIIEGTYNGLSKESFTDKINFSGSLNPGMSGGPALGHDGRVVGVNVSTAGNSLSFLVPVEPLRALIEQSAKRPKDFDYLTNAAADLEAQLYDLQKKNVEDILNRPWDSVSFGGFNLPGRIHPVFKCWGGAQHQQKDPFTYFRSTCSSQDGQFLDENFRTGTFSYKYDSVNAKEDLNLLRFADFYSQQYGDPLSDGDNADEENVTNFACNTSFVTAASSKWKASFCVRRYLKYPSLYDMQLYMALVGAGRQGMLIAFSAEGVSKENALALSDRFMREIRR